jgi:hypothetical protein
MGPPRWRGRWCPIGRQGVEAPAEVAQARKGESVRQGGTDGDAPRWRRDGGVAEAARDSGVPRSAVSCGGRRRWWPAPGALVNGGEVRSGGNLGTKPGEAELTMRPRWRQWRLPIGGVVRRPVPERGLASLQRVQGG